MLKNCHVQLFDFGDPTVPDNYESEAPVKLSTPSSTDKNIHPNLYHESFFPVLIAKIYSLFPKSAIMSRYECVFTTKSKKQFLIDERPHLARTKTINKIKMVESRSCDKYKTLFCHAKFV